MVFFRCGLVVFLQIQAWTVQMSLGGGRSQGLEVGITDYEGDNNKARRQGSRHLYVQLYGKRHHVEAVKPCMAYLTDCVLTDSLLIEPPSKTMIASATKMTKNATTEVVEYKSLAECHQLESDAEWEVQALSNVV